MAEIIRVVVNGAKGRMGAESVKAVQAADDMELVASTDAEDDLKSVIADKNPDVVVDFTVPDAAYTNAKIIMNSNAGGVIGTTGFSNEHLHEMRAHAENKKPGMILAPNFSIGAILMMHCAHLIAHHMSKVEIIEKHHDKKQDAPSGTAMKTADLISHAVRKDNVPRGTSETPAYGYIYKNIPIHSVRLPGLMAHQEVVFGDEGQTLTLRHDTINRSCYMPGVLLSIRECMKRPGVTYGLENILFAGHE